MYPTPTPSCLFDIPEELFHRGYIFFHKDFHHPSWQKEASSRRASRKGNELPIPIKPLTPTQRCLSVPPPARLWPLELFIDVLITSSARVWYDESCSLQESCLSSSDHRLNPCISYNVWLVWHEDLLVYCGFIAMLLHTRNKEKIDTLKVYWGRHFFLVTEIWLLPQIWVIHFFRSKIHKYKNIAIHIKMSRA